MSYVHNQFLRQFVKQMPSSSSPSQTRGVKRSKVYVQSKAIF